MGDADFRKVDLYIIFSKRVNPDFIQAVAENVKSGGPQSKGGMHEDKHWILTFT